MGFAKNNFRWRQNTPIHGGKKIKRELLECLYTFRADTK